MSVPMPLIRIAMFGLKPMRMGASTVAPNIAMTCCTPMAPVCSQGRRSSGATTLPSVAATSRQLNRLLMSGYLLGSFMCLVGFFRPLLSARCRPRAGRASGR